MDGEKLFQFLLVSKSLYFTLICKSEFCWICNSKLPFFFFEGLCVSPLCHRVSDEKLCDNLIGVLSICLLSCAQFSCFLYTLLLKFGCNVLQSVFFVIMSFRSSVFLSVFACPIFLQTRKFSLLSQ